MDFNKTEEGPAKPNVGLPRGLEHISHLFLSHSPPETATQEGSRTPPVEQPRTRPGAPAVAAVLRPYQSFAREQLVSLLKKQTAAIEEGMRAIDANIPCENAGNIELLALDSANQLAIIDVDDSPSDALLLRGIGQFDWIVRNIPNVRRMFPGQTINFSLQPRLFLVAPEFSPLSQCVTRHVTSPQIHCLKYHAIALPGGAGIFFEHVR